MNRLNFGFRALCLSSLIVLGSSCKSRDANEMGNSGSDEQAMISGSAAAITFFHTFNDTNVCLYNVSGKGRNVSSDSVLKGLLQEARPAAQSARYVNSDSLVRSARMIIDGSVDAKINMTSDFQKARTLAGEHDSLLSNLNKVLDSGIGGGAVFRDVYNRKKTNQPSCRGGFPPRDGGNQECVKNYSVKLKQLEAPLKAYLTFLDTQKKSGRLGGVSKVKTFNEVFDKQVVSNFGIQSARNPEVFMTPSEKQTLNGMRTEGQRLQQQVLSAYEAASKLSDNETQLPVKTDRRTVTGQDGSKVTTVTVVRDGGLTKVVGAEEIVQTALNEAFRSLQASSSSVACPDVSDLSKGLEFDVTETVTAAPQPSPTPSSGGSGGRSQVQTIQIPAKGAEVSVNLSECQSEFIATETDTNFGFVVIPKGSADGCANIAIKQFNFVGDGNNGKTVILDKSGLNQGQKCFTVHILSGGALSELRPNGQFVSDDNVSPAKKMDIVKVCKAQ